MIYSKEKKLFILALISILPMGVRASQTVVCKGVNQKSNKNISITLEVRQTTTSCEPGKYQDVIPCGDGGQDGSWDVCGKNTYDALTCNGEGELIQTVSINGVKVDSQTIAYKAQSVSLPPNLKYSTSIGENESMYFRDNSNILYRPSYKGLRLNTQNQFETDSSSDLTVVDGVHPFQVVNLICTSI